jgi:phage terminase large subunit-like protein
VKASRGKVVRAEPIAALYEQNKIKHAGYFPDLEDELCAFTTSGYVGQSSPNRADALVWAMTELFPGMTNSTLKLDIPPPNVGRSWAA